MANRFILQGASALVNLDAASLDSKKASPDRLLNDAYIANNSSPLNYHR